MEGRLIRLITGYAYRQSNSKRCDSRDTEGTDFHLRGRNANDPGSSGQRGSL